MNIHFDHIDSQVYRLFDRQTCVLRGGARITPVGNELGMMR